MKYLKEGTNDLGEPFDSINISQEFFEQLQNKDYSEISGLESLTWEDLNQILSVI